MGLAVMLDMPTTMSLAAATMSLARTSPSLPLSRTPAAGPADVITATSFSGRGAANTTFK